MKATHSRQNPPDVTSRVSTPAPRPPVPCVPRPLSGRHCRACPPPCYEPGLHVDVVFSKNSFLLTSAPARRPPHWHGLPLVLRGRGSPPGPGLAPGKLVKLPTGECLHWASFLSWLTRWGQALGLLWAGAQQWVGLWSVGLSLCEGVSLTRLRSPSASLCHLAPSRPRVCLALSPSRQNLPPACVGTCGLPDAHAGY